MKHVCSHGRNQFYDARVATLALKVVAQRLQHGCPSDAGDQGQLVDHSDDDRDGFDDTDDDRQCGHANEYVCMSCFSCNCGEHFDISDHQVSLN